MVISMIRSFRPRWLKRLYERGDKSRVNAQQVDKIERILANLDAASHVTDMDLPGYKFYMLKAEWKEHYSVWVTGNWRVVFRFSDEAEDVALIDHH